MRKKAAIFAALALIAGTIFTTTTASAGAAQDGQLLRSYLNTSLCLTVSDGNVGNGAGVIMTECSVTDTGQRWFWDGLNLRSVQSLRCLTAAWNNVGDGAALHMWDCRGWYAQMFYRPGGENLGRIQQIQSPNPCVEVSGANPRAGASVQLWTCHGGSNHRWTV
ncbi:RICIN domain-containing protein [Lentzea sp. NPDC051838]|uniref:RICIN domain-containing protein n=1 Tax=Lentzea sp. NPDC051838 TaxID=3154849 RepID=UPI003436E32A